jgi:hypothetical protein
VFNLIYIYVPGTGGKDPHAFSVSKRDYSHIIQAVVFGASESLLKLWFRQVAVP